MSVHLPWWLGLGQLRNIALAFWAIAIIAVFFNRAQRREAKHITFYGWIAISCTALAIAFDFITPKG